VFGIQGWTKEFRSSVLGSVRHGVCDKLAELVSVRKGSFLALGRWDRPPIWPLPSAVAQAGSRRSARRYIGTPPRNPSLRQAQGKLFPCTFRCGAGQSGDGGAPNCTRQDEKCLLSERKPRGAWNLSRGFRMDTSIGKEPTESLYFPLDDISIRF